ncbi:MAG: orotate phosphoribosyltransferase [Oscillospiraceae bacterium]|jgi:orotate phosphoribosyltransferase|nr:orotate phosphoribosyltransferase [Oscillospiraceae bacterium]
MDYKKIFVHFMVRSGALTFGEFTLKSGRKSPYFINTGKYNTAAQISALGDFYAACINGNIPPEEYDMLYGPAYKGIPLVVSGASALFRNYNIDKPFAFNRKEAKDHGEGGLLVGYAPKNGDRVLIIEDVMTSGRSIRESFPILKAAADIKLKYELISVDRMERGTGGKSAVQEIEDEFGLKVFSIVNILDVIKYLHNQPVDGTVYIDDKIKSRIESGLAY